MCIGHAEDGRFVADVVRGTWPPFDPGEVARSYAALIREYRCASVTGDNFAGEWTSQAFRVCNVPYVRSPLVKSGLYLEALPIFNRGMVSLPPNAMLERELRTLERHTHRSGKDVIDHPPSGSDDLANAVCGAVYLAFLAPQIPTAVMGGWSGNVAGPARPSRLEAEARLWSRPSTISIPDDSKGVDQFKRWAMAQSTKPPPPSMFAAVDAQRRWNAQPPQGPLCEVPRASGVDPWEA